MAFIIHGPGYSTHVRTVRLAIELVEVDMMGGLG